jgi:hypothetical protein
MNLHYDGGGHGPILDEETVVMLVMDDSGLKPGERLDRNQFRKQRLKDGDVSLARRAYATIKSVEEFIVIPAMSRGRTVIGASSSLVKSIRSINPVMEGCQDRMGGVCVLAQVCQGDHDSHAALRECQERGLAGHKGDKQAKIRALVVADLVNKFGVIEDISATLPETAPYSPPLLVCRGRPVATWGRRWIHSVRSDARHKIVVPAPRSNLTSTWAQSHEVMVGTG